MCRKKREKEPHSTKDPVSIGSHRKGGSTREFGQHPLSEGVLLAFIEWLGTVDGKNRTPKQATEIAVDVSKFLHFCSQEAVHQIHFSYTPAEFNRYLTTQTVKLTWPSYSLAHT